MGLTDQASPASHEEALDRVMQFVDIVAARTDIDDKELFDALRKRGVGDVDADLLIAFVPSAFSFALLKLMGLNKFPSTFQVRDASGNWVELPLAAEHYFIAALGVGYEVTTGGYTERISKETFTAITLRSAEMGAVNKFFEAGGTKEELAESTLGPPTLFGVTAERIAASRRNE